MCCVSRFLCYTKTKKSTWPRSATCYLNLLNTSLRSLLLGCCTLFSYIFVNRDLTPDSKSYSRSETQDVTKCLHLCWCSSQIISCQILVVKLYLPRSPKLTCHPGLWALTRFGLCSQWSKRPGLMQTLLHRMMSGISFRNIIVEKSSLGLEQVTLPLCGSH